MSEAAIQTNNDTCVVDTSALAKEKKALFDAFFAALEQASEIFNGNDLDLAMQALKVAGLEVKEREMRFSSPLRKISHPQGALLARPLPRSSLPVGHDLQGQYLPLLSDVRMLGATSHVRASPSISTRRSAFRLEPSRF